MAFCHNGRAEYRYSSGTELAVDRPDEYFLTRFTATRPGLHSYLYEIRRSLRLGQCLRLGVE